MTTTYTQPESSNICGSRMFRLSIGTASLKDRPLSAARCTCNSAREKRDNSEGTSGSMIHGGVSQVIPVISLISTHSGEVTPFTERIT